MNNDHLTHFVAPFLILSAIASVLFVSIHSATLKAGDLQMASYAVPKAPGLIYVKAPPASQPTRLTAASLAQRG